MAQIIHHRIAMPFDRFRVEYEWRGEGLTARLDRMALHYLGIPWNEIKMAQLFWLGHLELVVVDKDWESLLIEVVLVNGQGYQAAYRRQLFYFWQKLRSRIILTLYVWGLADAPMGEILSWKHIHWGRKK